VKSRPLILIVDDDPEIRGLLQKVLVEGHELMHAGDGNQALQAARERVPDLIISDVMMPGMDGFEFCVRVRTDPLLQRTPFLLLTGLSDLNHKLRGLEHRADDYVTKPFHTEEIAARVHNLIDKRRLEQELEARLKQMESDLALARSVQRQLLPVRIPPLPNAHFETLFRPIAELGGDFFEFVVLPDRLGLFICDVAGHGIPAALMASMVRIVLGNAAIDAGGPGDLLCRLNRQLLQTAGERYVTAFYATIDLRTLQIRFSSAGHIPPLLIRDGSAIPLEAHGPLLGAFPKDEWDEAVFGLKRGDRLFFYTDGVTDCRDPSGEHYGEERLVRRLLKDRASSARFMLDSLFQEISDFVDGRAFADDITAFAIDITAQDH